MFDGVKINVTDSIIAYHSLFHFSREDVGKKPQWLQGRGVNMIVTFKYSLQPQVVLKPYLILTCDDVS